SAYESHHVGVERYVTPEPEFHAKPGIEAHVVVAALREIEVCHFGACEAEAAEQVELHPVSRIDEKNGVDEKRGFTPLFSVEILPGGKVDARGDGEAGREPRPYAEPEPAHGCIG